MGHVLLTTRHSLILQATRGVAVEAVIDPNGMKYFFVLSPLTNRLDGRPQHLSNLPCASAEVQMSGMWDAIMFVRLF